MLCGVYELGVDSSGQHLENGEDANYGQKIPSENNGFTTYSVRQFAEIDIKRGGGNGRRSDKPDRCRIVQAQGVVEKEDSVKLRRVPDGGESGGGSKQNAECEPKSPSIAERFSNRCFGHGAMLFHR